MTSTERRVLFIGDSFATRDAAECLQEALNAYGVSVGRSYNVSLAGYPGLGLEHFLPDVRDKVEKLRPDLLIHVYPDTDANRHYSRLKRLVYGTSKRAVQGWARWYRFSKRIEEYSPLLGDLIWRISLATFLKEIDIRQGLRLDLLILRDFAELLKRSGTAYIVCLWDVELYGLTSRFREGLRSLNGQRTLYLTELNEYLALFHRSQYQIPNDGHPNRLGNRVMARYIVEEAARADLL